MNRATIPARAYLAQVHERLGANAPETWWVKDAPNDLENWLAEQFPGTEEFTPCGGFYWPPGYWDTRHVRHTCRCVPGIGVHVQWDGLAGWTWSQEIPARAWPLALPVWADPVVVVANVGRLLFGPQVMLSEGDLPGAAMTPRPSEAVWSGAPR